MSLNKIKKEYFSTKDANKKGVTNRALSYYVKTGRIQRVSRGLYTFSSTISFDLKDIVKEKLAIFPGAIVGFNTSLRLYNLTEETLPKIDLILPNKNRTTKIDEDVRIHYMLTNYDLGKEMHEGIPVTGIERTIIDLLKQGDSLSSILDLISIAKTKNRPIDLARLLSLAENLRAKRKVNMLIEAMY